jgi:hypothetical protein
MLLHVGQTGHALARREHLGAQGTVEAYRAALRGVIWKSEGALVGGILDSEKCSRLSDDATARSGIVRGTAQPHVRPPLTPETTRSRCLISTTRRQCYFSDRLPSLPLRLSYT